MRTTIGLLCAGLVAGLLFAPACFAASHTPVFIEYSGFGYYTAYQLVDDEFPATLNLVDGKGTFGQTSLTVTLELEIDFAMAPNCPSTDYLPLSAVDHDWGVVMTTPDLSQLFGQFDTGWLCQNLATGHYVGFTSGEFIGGIGRFTGASGSWTSDFQGFTIDPSIGLRSLDGTLVGTVEWP